MKPSVINVKRTRPLLGTYVRIELRARVGRSRAATEAFLQRCITCGFQAVEQIDRLMSVHRSDSEISRLNRAPAGWWMRMHPLTLQVLSAANSLHTASGGVFDVRRPARDVAASEFETTPLEIRGQKVSKTGPWEFDLGGIAKGFAVDYAVRRLQRELRGLTLSGTVNAGGDLRVWGKQPQPISVQIDNQAPRTLNPIEALPKSVATSAFRDSSDRLTGVVYWKMGSPVAPGRSRAVTVFADCCLDADALTKVVMLGKPSVASRCLSLYNARAIVFGPAGRAIQVLP